MKRTCKNCGSEEGTHMLVGSMRFDDYCSVSCMKEKAQSMASHYWELLDRIKGATRRRG